MHSIFGAPEICFANFSGPPRKTRRLLRMKNAIKGFIKESFLIGLGAASLTKKKAETLAKSLVKKGILSRKDGAALARKILTEANNERKRIENFVKIFNNFK